MGYYINEINAEILPEDNKEGDDDPQCVCGVYLSEHAAMGCSEGFQTPTEWNAWKRDVLPILLRQEDPYYEADYEEYCVDVCSNPDSADADTIFDCGCVSPDEDQREDFGYFGDDLDPYG